MSVALPDILEREWTAQVVQLARTLGYLRYHTHLSKRSASGFPDEVLVRERVIFLELKREKGLLSESQRVWLRALQKADAEVYLARPRHLDDLGLILACRRDPTGGHLANAGARKAEERLRQELRRDLAA